MLKHFPIQNFFFKKNVFRGLIKKQKQQNYKIIIQTQKVLIWFKYLQNYKILYQSFPIKKKCYSFIKASHKYSTAKRQVLLKKYTYSFSCKKKQIQYLRFFCLFAPPGLILILKKIL